MSKADTGFILTDLFNPHLKLLLFATQGISGIRTGKNSEKMYQLTLCLKIILYYQ